MNKNFYLCTKVKTKIVNKPILFYHVPKCAGTTFGVIFSWLLSPQTRVKGPLFKNNDKRGETAFELFNRCDDYNFFNKFNFIFGHLPFEIDNLFKKSFYKISLLRNPIDRTISHYNWMMERQYCSQNDDIQNLFDENKITKNTITNQFSGIGFTKKNDDKSLTLAYENLTKKIDFLCKSEHIFYLFKFLLSHYNLPNLLFQNQQVTKYQNNIISNNLKKTIINNNSMDIELYNMLCKNNIFKTKKILGKKISDDRYFFSSPDIKIENKKNILINKNQYNSIKSKLIQNNFKIEKL